MALSHITKSYTVELDSKQKYCYDQLKKYIIYSTLKSLILFGPKNKYYANKIGIDLNNIEQFEQNVITKPLLKLVGKKWISFIQNTKLAIYNKKYFTGFWKHISFKMNEHNHIIVKLDVYNKEIKHDIIIHSYFDKLIKDIDLEFNTTHTAVYLQYTSTNSMPTKNDNIILVYGAEGMTEKIMDIEFTITPYTFSQGNPYTCQMLYEYVHKFIDNICLNPLICYGRNIGHICFTLGKDCKVYGFNPCPIVHKDLQNTIINNKIIPSINIQLDPECNLFADYINKYDSNHDIIISPGRNGLKPIIIKAIKVARHKIKYFYYISCYIKSLVRDLDDINGCILEKIQPIDLFPRTPFCEILVKITL